MNLTHRFAAMLGLLVLLASPAGYGVEAGDAAPLWQSTDLQGNAITFPDAQSGQTTILVFWATWCPYCQAFMPNLAGIARDYAGRNVRVLAINAKENGEGDPRAYMTSHGYPFVTVLDGDAIAQAYGVEFIPGLMIVDPNGVVSWRRSWTELPAGRTVADLWDMQVRAVLDARR